MIYQQTIDNKYYDFDAKTQKFRLARFARSRKLYGIPLRIMLTSLIITIILKVNYEIILTSSSMRRKLVQLVIRKSVARVGAN